MNKNKGPEIIFRATDYLQGHIHIVWQEERELTGEANRRGIPQRVTGKAQYIQSLGLTIWPFGAVLGGTLVTRSGALEVPELRSLMQHAEILTPGSQKPFVVYQYRLVRMGRRGKIEAKWVERTLIVSDNAYIEFPVILLTKQKQIKSRILYCMPGQEEFVYSHIALGKTGSHVPG